MSTLIRNKSVSVLLNSVQFISSHHYHPLCAVLHIIKLLPTSMYFFCTCGNRKSAEENISKETNFHFFSLR